MEGPEVHQPHARHKGGLPQWLELTIAGTALVTSISSIAIAVHHGQIMEKLVQANSIPYIIGGFSTVTMTGDQVLSLDLLNRGVGPAQERSLRVQVDGRYVTSVQALLAASLGPEQAGPAATALNISKNKVPTRFIAPGGQQPVFFVARKPENAHYWDLLAAAQPRWNIDYCYCSVFEDCWQVSGKWEEPKPIEECVRDDPHEFMP